MTYRIGVIAEDDSDVAVLCELITKIATRQRFKIRKFAAQGSGKIRGKCFQWAFQLKREGCTLLIVLHDLDQNTLPELEMQIQSALNTCPIKKNVIVIPIREIEAWLLSDGDAIQQALNLKQRVSHIPNPQSLLDPKRRLADIIYFKSGKTKRYVPSDNQRIAKVIALANIRRCSSFLPLEEFIRTNMH